MIAKSRMKWRYTSRMNDSTSEEMPSSWREWRRLCNLMPELDRMHVVHHVNQKPPPRPMTDTAFLQFAACFADPLKRKLLSTLIWDLIGEDMLKMFQASNPKEY